MTDAAMALAFPGAVRTGNATPMIARDHRISAGVRKYWVTTTAKKIKKSTELKSNVVVPWLYCR